MKGQRVTKELVLTELKQRLERQRLEVICKDSRQEIKDRLIIVNQMLAELPKEIEGCIPDFPSTTQTFISNSYITVDKPANPWCAGYKIYFKVKNTTEDTEDIKILGLHKKVYDKWFANESYYKEANN